MKLRGTDGTQFELEVVGYQFPEIDPDPHEVDANWLNIRLSVRGPDRSWAAIEPCLETCEVADLAQWFEAIAAGNAVDCDACFTEATLRFALQEDDPTKMRVYFWPGWTPRDEASTGDEDVFIECDACAEALHTAAASLRAQLEKFPIRRADQSLNS
jgi:hypothetical protein